MYEVIVEQPFSAAHYLKDYPGKCSQIHGHNYKVQITVEGDTLDHLGLLVEFEVIKQAVKKWIDLFDHGFLNELPPFDKINPSAENLAKFFYDEVEGAIGNPEQMLRRESPTSGSSRPRSARPLTDRSLKAMAEQTHQSDTKLLGRRSLAQDHRGLAPLLRPGISVLDVGCGSGAITRGIADAVGPHGCVIGIDKDLGLLEIGRQEYAGISNLQLQQGDILNMSYVEQFDIVTAARTLQWLSAPQLAITRMKQAAKRSGLLVVLDYNHSQNRWDPDPPVAFQTFYQAFLAWRESNGWDNNMADHLPQLFEAAGLVEIESVGQDDIASSGSDTFANQIELWPRVVDNISEQLVASGFLNKAQLQLAKDSFSTWAQTELKTQVLAMKTVVGRVP